MNIKKGLEISILVLYFVILTNNSNAQSCSDTDNIDYYVKGILTINGMNYADECIDDQGINIISSGKLREYYCEGNDYKTQIIECYCDQGKCQPKPACGAENKDCCRSRSDPGALTCNQGLTCSEGKCIKTSICIPTEQKETICNDNIDNDCDKLIDSQDNDCVITNICKEDKDCSGNMPYCNSQGKCAECIPKQKGCSQLKDCSSINQGLMGSCKNECIDYKCQECKLDEKICKVKNNIEAKCGYECSESYIAGYCCGNNEILNLATNKCESNLGECRKYMPVIPKALCEKNNLGIKDCKSIVSGLYYMVGDCKDQVISVDYDLSDYNINNTDNVKLAKYSYILDSCFGWVALQSRVRGSTIGEVSAKINSPGVYAAIYSKENINQSKPEDCYNEICPKEVNGEQAYCISINYQGSRWYTNKAIYDSNGKCETLFGEYAIAYYNGKNQCNLKSNIACCIPNSQPFKGWKFYDDLTPVEENLCFKDQGPVLLFQYINPEEGYKGTKFSITVSGSRLLINIKEIKAIISNQNSKVKDLTMYDDGEHGDDKAKDGRYGVIIDSKDLDEGVYFVDIEAIRNDGSLLKTEQKGKFSVINKVNIDCKEAVSGHNKINENRINIIFAGINYKSLDEFKRLADLSTDFNGVGKGIFSVEPFKSNKNKFNLWYVDQIGKVDKYEEGWTNRGYEANNIISLLQTACIMNKKEVIGLVNWYFRSQGGDPTVNSVLEGSNDITVVVHEIGHGIGELADEYVEFAEDYQGSNLINEQCFYSSKDKSKQYCNNNALFKDLYGNGCGKDGIIDCNDPDLIGSSRKTIGMAVLNLNDPNLPSTLKEGKIKDINPKSGQLGSEVTIELEPNSQKLSNLVTSSSIYSFETNYNPYFWLSDFFIDFKQENNLIKFKFDQQKKNLMPFYGNHIITLIPALTSDADRNNINTKQIGVISFFLNDQNIEQQTFGIIKKLDKSSVKLGDTVKFQVDDSSKVGGVYLSSHRINIKGDYYFGPSHDSNDIIIETPYSIEGNTVTIQISLVEDEKTKPFLLNNGILVIGILVPKLPELDLRSSIEVQCYQGGCYYNNIYRPNFNTIMRCQDCNLLYSYGPVNERLICNVIKRETGSAGGVCLNTCLEHCQEGKKCIKGICQ